MLKLFLNNIFVNNLLLIPYICILRLNSFINPPEYDPYLGYSPILDFLYQDTSPLVLSIFAVFLIFIQANLINYFVNTNKLNSKNNILAGLFYSLGMCLLPQFLVLHPIMIANTFIILMMIQLSNIYKVYKPIKALFMAGFYCGLSYLLIPHYIILIFFIIQAILMLRDINLKEFLQGTIGVLTPIFLLITISLDRNQNGFTLLKKIQFNVPSIPKNFEVIDWVGVTVLFIVIFYLVLNQGKIRKKKSVKAQLLSSLLYILIFYSIPMMLFKTALVPQHLFILVIPISILFTMLVFATRRLVLAEVLHFITMVFIILFQFDLII